MLKYRCELFAARPSNGRLPLALAPFYSLHLKGGSEATPPGGSLGYKSRASTGIPFHSIDQSANGNISPLTKLAVAYPFISVASRAKGSYRNHMPKVPILYQKSL